MSSAASRCAVILFTLAVSSVTANLRAQESVYCTRVDTQDCLIWTSAEADGVYVSTYDLDEMVAVSSACVNGNSGGHALSSGDAQCLTPRGQSVLLPQVQIAAGETAAANCGGYGKTDASVAAQTLWTPEEPGGVLKGEVALMFGDNGGGASQVADVNLCVRVDDSVLYVMGGTSYGYSVFGSLDTFNGPTVISEYVPAGFSYVYTWEEDIDEQPIPLSAVQSWAFVEAYYYGGNATRMWDANALALFEIETD